jgi:hypothetical protein
MSEQMLLESCKCNDTKKVQELLNLSKLSHHPYNLLEHSCHFGRAFEIAFDNNNSVIMSLLIHFYEITLIDKFDRTDLQYMLAKKKLVNKLEWIINNQNYSIEMKNVINEVLISNKLLERSIQFKTVQEEAFELFKKKNQDYGDAFATYGSIGIMVRMGDKIQRLLSISQSGIQLVDNEGLRDTLIDLHNYAAMAVFLLDENKTN